MVILDLDSVSKLNYLGREEGKDQEPIQSTDPRHCMGKWQKHKEINKEQL